MKRFLLFISIIVSLAGIKTAHAARTQSDWLLDPTGTFISPAQSPVNVLISGANRYLNFGTFSGSSGYGFRDNGGVVEFKNNFGAWTPIGTGGGGSGGGTWSTTTSSVAGDLFNYSNNNTDIVLIGGTSSSTAKFYFDPNINVSKIGGTASTTSLIISGITGTQCLHSINGLVSGSGSDCGTGSGGGSAYPFTPTTNFGALNQATTGIAWYQNGLNASSTSHFVSASSTNISAFQYYFSHENSPMAGLNAALGENAIYYGNVAGSVLADAGGILKYFNASGGNTGTTLASQHVLNYPSGDAALDDNGGGADVSQLHVPGSLTDSNGDYGLAVQCLTATGDPDEQVLWGSCGGGSSQWTNSGATTTLTTGTVASAPVFYGSNPNGTTTLLGVLNVGSSTYQGALNVNTTGINAPVSGTAINVLDDTADYFEQGDTPQYLVYAYKTVGGHTIYSQPLVIRGTYDGNANLLNNFVQYSINVSWTPVIGATGYQVILFSPQMAYNTNPTSFNAPDQPNIPYCGNIGCAPAAAGVNYVSYTTTSTSFVDGADANVTAYVTGSTPPFTLPTGADFTVHNTSGNVAAHGNIDANGAITSYARVTAPYATFGTSTPYHVSYSADGDSTSTVSIQSSSPDALDIWAPGTSAGSSYGGISLRDPLGNLVARIYDVQGIGDNTVGSSCSTAHCSIGFYDFDNALTTNANKDLVTFDASTALDKNTGFASLNAASTTNTKTGNLVNFDGWNGSVIIAPACGTVGASQGNFASSLSSLGVGCGLAVGPSYATSTKAGNGVGLFQTSVGIGTTSPWRALSVSGSSDLGTNALVTYASTTITSATTLCLSTDCRTVWPTGGSGAAYPFTPTTNFGALNQATTGIAWYQNGLNASSTSHFDSASTTITSATTLCLSTDCRTAWPTSGSSGGGSPVSGSTTQNVLSGTVINTSSGLNYKSIGADTSFTFSGAPTAGTWFGLQVHNTDFDFAHKISIPSSHSIARNKNVTKATVLPNTSTVNGDIFLYWYYDGSTYFLFGDNNGVDSDVGTFTTLYGYNAGGAATGADLSTFIGYNAGANQNYGGSDGQAVAVGYNAGLNPGGYAGTFIGYTAGQAGGGTSAVGLGYGAMSTASNGGTGSVAIGVHALQTATINGTIGIGYHTGNGAGDLTNTVAIGDHSAGLANGSSTDSIFLGPYSGIGRNNTLWIDGQSTSANSIVPLIYGEFDNHNLTINGSGLFGQSTTEGTASSSAALEVRSTTKGFLPSRMTAAQKNAISSPVTGLVVYQTDGSAGLQEYDGSSWNLISTSTNTWSTTTSSVAGEIINHPNNNTDIVTIGSASTTTAPFYVDPNKSLTFATNASTTNLSVTNQFNFPVGAVSSKGNVDIGTTTATGAGLYIAADDPSPNSGGITMEEYSNTQISTLLGRRAKGSEASPTQAINGSGLVSIVGSGYTSSGLFSTSANSSAIKIIAAENFTSTAEGSFMTFGTVPIGSVTPAEVMRLDTTGNVGIGSTSPAARLSIQSNSASGDAFDVATTTNTLIGGYDNDGHRFTSGYTPALSSCGTGSPTVTGDDQTGTITTGTAATSCTMTFVHSYRATPVCNFNDDSTTIPGDISSISTTAVTFALGAGLSGGHLYYQCSYHK